MNFLEWIRDIDLELLNKKFSDISKYNFKNEFDKNKSIDDYENELTQIANEIHKLENFENKILISNDKNNDLDQLKSKYEYLLELLDIVKNCEEDKNSFYQKATKYKILYFLYGAYLYLNANYLKRNLDKEYEFFKNESNLKWYAFENGPILSTYQYGEKDKQIDVNFKEMPKPIEDFLKECYINLKGYPLEVLIEESHATDPWKNAFKPNSWYKEINLNDIKKYFENNKPFFVKE